MGRKTWRQLRHQGVETIRCGRRDYVVGKTAIEAFVKIAEERAKESTTALHIQKPENLFGDIPSDLPEELLSTLHKTKFLRIERIVSQGHASPPGFWYDQKEHEWVIVLKGSAVIEFEGSATLELHEGTYLNIPAHVRHRVVSTSPAEKTIWLAIHYTD